MTISPTPWRYVSDNDDPYVENANRMLVCDEVRREDGPLIAAAPDLQAALRELVARIEEIESFIGNCFNPALAAARAALKRAENVR